MENKFGIEELVDTSVDVIETAKTVVETLADGIQITDVGALFSIAPKIKEVIQDGRQAVRELLDLTPDESEAAARQIAERTGQPFTGILGKVNDGLQLLARVHREVVDDIELFQDCKAFALSLRV